MIEPFLSSCLGTLTERVPAAASSKLPCFTAPAPAPHLISPPNPCTSVDCTSLAESHTVLPHAVHFLAQLAPM